MKWLELTGVSHFSFKGHLLGRADLSIYGEHTTHIFDLHGIESGGYVIEQFLSVSRPLLGGGSNQDPLPIFAIIPDRSAVLSIPGFSKWALEALSQLVGDYNAPSFLGRGKKFDWWSQRGYRFHVLGQSLYRARIPLDEGRYVDTELIQVGASTFVQYRNGIDLAEVVILRDARRFVRCLPTETARAEAVKKLKKVLKDLTASEAEAKEAR